jgi:predicted nucleic acid-binding protein
MPCARSANAVDRAGCLGGPRDLNRYPHDVLLDRIWELRHDASAYDAAYLALAEVLEAPLLTSDARLGDVPDARAVLEIL